MIIVDEADHAAADNIWLFCSFVCTFAIDKTTTLYLYISKFNSMVDVVGQLL